MPRLISLSILLLALFTRLAAGQAAPAPQAQLQTKPAAAWTVGTPIVTYWAGPAMTEEVARQMVEGGFNVVWCGEKDLDLLHRHKLRGMLHDPLLNPAAVDVPAQRAKLDALVDRVRNHPALYAYFLTDEPSAKLFPALGKLIGHLRERDPAHLAYLNLFPTYASNEQLGTTGGVVAAYREYLRRHIEEAKPGLVSYDHYQFYKAGDTKQYFLNLALVRKASMDAGLPWLNIIQASAWEPTVRVPTADETRYLVYTTLAYGAHGVSYYVYYAPGHEGMIVDAAGKTKPIYETLKTLNPEFVAVATELQPLRSLAVYHTSMKEEGCVPLPADVPFRPEAPPAPGERGLALGYFGKADAPTHVVVANLDYRAATRVALTGPGDLEVFDATTGKWTPANGARAELQLPPGGGKLVRHK